jgi:tetratricopeptide (TPR) repeat protein
MIWWWKALTLGGIALGATSDWHREAEARERAQGIESAIALVEQHLAESSEDVEAWRWMARTLERLAGEEDRSPLLFSDAAAAWERVVALNSDDDASRMAAARAWLRAGEFSAAEVMAGEVIERQREGDGRASDEAVALFLRSRTAAFERSRSRSRGRTLLAADLTEVLARIEHAGELAPLGVERGRVEAEWLASVHLPDLAIARLHAAISESPSSIELHRALVDQHLRLAIEERLPARYRELMAEHPENAVVRWYAGYVARLAGDLAARERRNDDAALLFAASVERMRESVELSPSFAESALWVEMQARTGAAWSALDADDVEGADAGWQAVVEEWPEFAMRADGLGRTPAQGMGRLGHRFLLRDDLVSAERVSRRVAEISREAWSWNNVAFLLREIASDTEQSGDSAMFDVARSGFVESWKTYQRAAALAPHEPRIINDTALIQIYHLQDDLDGAEQMLRRAIDVGEQQLEEMGEFAEEGERFPIAQAVGDAYQNLGYLYYRLRGESGKARGYFIKSVETDSGARRGVVASIRAIDSGRALEEPPPGGPPPISPKAAEELLKDRKDPLAPEGGGVDAAPSGGGGGSISPASASSTASPFGADRRPERIPEREPTVDWECSIALALEAGEREERPVLVYHRVGGGIGPAVEYLQRYLHSDGFARATSGAITLLADGLRHTFVDRRRDGRLVFCPRSGGLTCAEHLATGEEFLQRWAAQEGGRIGLEANGLYRVTADGLSRVGRSEDTFERLPRSWGRRTGSEGTNGETAENTSENSAGSMGAAPGAHDLARSGRLKARRALERVIFEGKGVEREEAVAAISAHSSRENDELLIALVRQHADEDLAVLALLSWPGPLGSSAPIFALSTSPSSRVRRAAALALARVADEEAELALVARWIVAQRGSIERLEAIDLETLAREID